ncbi:hypothetical protein [Streptomyces sp. NPDC008125]|uniref:hypothetical protein n=1 Tax=Streptomyces sp. NPDC008125 TaxID=3364811 RepID=UPI0036ECFB18
MSTYMINWAAVNEVLDQLTTVQTEIETLNEQFASGNTAALAGWDSSVKELFDANKAQWNQATANMGALAQQAQSAAASCRDDYVSAVNYGTQLWSK